MNTFMRRSSLGLFVLGTACKSNTGDAPGPPATHVAAATSAASTAGSFTATPPSTAPSTTHSAPWLLEADVLATFERWLLHQNNVDFPAYSSLYAPRFTGTKRVGARTTRFNRESWLEDRHGMFKPGLEVNASDVKVTVSGPLVAQVAFVQDFSSPRFSDRGKKQLLLTQTPEGLRIASEEMLESSVSLDTTGTLNTPVWFVDDNLLFTRTSLTKKEFPTAPTTFTTDGTGLYTLRAPPPKAAFPEAAQALQGKSLTFINREGKSCPAKVKHLLGHIRIVPHFGMAQSWNGQNGEKRATNAEITKQLWEMAGDEVPVVAEISASCGDTGLIAWESPTLPTLTPPKPASPEITALIRKQFAKLPELERIERELPNRAGPWYTDANVEVATFDGPDGTRWAIAKAAEERECRHIAGVTAAFELGGQPGPAIKRQFTFVGEPLTVIGLLTLPNDPVPTFFAGPRDVSDRYELWRLGTKTPLVPLATVSYFDCPC